MARRVSKGRVSEQMEKEEEEKRAQRKLMDERELRRLTRETRMMKEAKLKDATVEKNTKIKNILINQNDDLVDNLNLMKSKRRCVLDTKQSQNIANLFAQGDDLDAAIAQEKNYIKDLESQIQKDTQNIQALKKKKGTMISSSDYLQKKENERADRTLESWKSRLAAEQTQLALVIKENEEMRKKLRRLLKEKGQFNKLFEELMGKLTKGKRIMADIAEQSRQEFQKRDEVTRKIEALRSRDKADLTKRMEEMQDLEKRMYEDKKLADFRHRVQQVREKLVGGMRSSHKDTMEQAKLMKLFEKTNEFWDRLKEATGLQTADEISKYIMNEDSSLFSLFTFNNEIRDQLEVMTQKTAELVNTVDEEQVTAEEQYDQEMKSRNSMEKKLGMLEQTFNDLNDHCDANARLFSRLLDKIKILFDFMKCKTSVLRDLLGNNMEVTEHNYRLYLGLIETEVIDALEILTLAFPPTVTIKPSHKTLSTVRSMTKIKSTVSIVDKRVVTVPCCESLLLVTVKYLKSDE